MSRANLFIFSVIGGIVIAVTLTAVVCEIAPLAPVTFIKYVTADAPGLG